ncbi:MmgE/PrpD family protein [Chloroflexota bacterium]
MSKSKTEEKEDAVVAFAANLANIGYEDIPAEVAEVTKMSILDAMGVSLAVSSMVPSCKSLAELVKEMGGKKESTIIGYGGKVPCHMAAFVNATLAHALNYEDHHVSIKVGCTVFPAAFATAERVGAVTGKEFITAYALSMDLECRLARAIWLVEKPCDWIVYGWVLVQMFGYFGAAAAAGRLLRLDENQLVNAFGLAYSQVAGSQQVFMEGGDKAIFPAFPASAGVISALMAQKSIAGPQESLEGKAGLYKLYFQGEYDSASLTRDLGKSFQTVGFQQFPCCVFTHTPIELALRMAKEYKIRPQDIDTITVFGGDKIRNLCQPLEIRRNPRTMSEAQFSIPFTVATAIAKGKPRIEHFTSDGIKDPEILYLSNRVSSQLDLEFEPQSGTGVQPAKIEIKLTDGRILRSEQRDLRYGHPQRPISKGELIEKFRDCASHSVRPLPNKSIEKVIEMVTNLEEIDDVSKIIRLVS